MHNGDGTMDSLFIYRGMGPLQMQRNHSDFFFETKMTKKIMMMMVKIVNCRPAFLPLVKSLRTRELYMTMKLFPNSIIILLELNCRMLNTYMQ